jgi:hypothetical protein
MKKYHNMVVDVCDWKVRGYFPMETFDHAAQIICRSKYCMSRSLLKACFNGFDSVPKSYESC